MKLNYVGVQKKSSTGILAINNCNFNVCKEFKTCKMNNFIFFKLIKYE